MNHEWLLEDPNRISPHEVFNFVKDRRKIALEYADFSSKAINFASFDSMIGGH